jgi:hypothetical protein
VDDWPFADDPGRMSVTTVRIVAGGPILGVLHHEDGDWEFVDDGPFREEDAAAVHLKHLLEWDDSMRECADLPRGWGAWRNDPAEPWGRYEIEPYESET